MHYAFLEKFSAFFFDFDGTLADGYPGIASAVNSVRAMYGHQPLSVREIKGYVGRGLDHLLIHTIPGGKVEDDINHYRSYYQQSMFSGTTLLPGVLATMFTLQANGKRIAVCSNKKQAFTEQLVKALGIMPPIETVYGPDDVPNAKPAPDMLKLAAESIGIPVRKCLYIGDMDVDIEAARAAEMPVWVVATGAMSMEALKAHKPDQLFPSMKHLCEFLPRDTRDVA